jgi:hypothetical protein
MMADLGGVAPGAGYVAQMTGALRALTGKASAM